MPECWENMGTFQLKLVIVIKGIRFYISESNYVGIWEVKNIEKRVWLSEDNWFSSKQYDPLLVYFSCGMLKIFFGWGGGGEEGEGMGLLVHIPLTGSYSPVLPQIPKDD